MSEFLNTGREQSIKVIMGVSRDAALIRRGQDFVASRASFAPRRTGRPSRVDTGKVMTLLASGMSLRGVGYACGISRETVRNVAQKHGKK